MPGPAGGGAAADAEPTSFTALLRSMRPRASSSDQTSSEPAAEPAEETPAATALTASVASALSIPADASAARVAARRVSLVSAASLTDAQRARRAAVELALSPDDARADHLAAEAAHSAGAPGDDAAAATACRWNEACAARFDDLLARAGMPDKRPRPSSAGISSSEIAGSTRSAGPSDAGESGSGGGIASSWLRERCARALSAAGGAGGDVSHGEVAASVLSLLMEEKRSAEEIQELLFDALCGDFDAVADVLAHRAEVVANADAVLADCLGGPLPGVGGTPPGVGGTSAMGAARRRARANRVGAEDMPALPALGGSAAAELQRQFPGVVPDSDRAIGEVDRVGLPSGATRTIGVGYEEIFVPPAIPKSNVRLGDLIEVRDAFGEHPELLQAMKGVTTFNRLQSAVFPVAYASGDNLLVCAPTGAGKTNVALLTVFQQIVAVKSRAQNEFKIVYVAPMKALAAEVVEKFGKKLSPLGLKVREFTGDMSLTRREAAETHVLVTTPEKWDVVTRKSASSLSSSITLLIIDEVHLLHDDRGAVLESIVARTLRLSETAQKRIRLVGLSATLPNYEDVAAFLRVDPARGLFHFDSGHRPVPLSQTFVGVSAGGTGNSGESRRKREMKMTELTWEKVKDSLQRGHQAMVFVHSRKQTASTAREIIGCAAQDSLEDILLGGEAPAAAGSSSSVPHEEDESATKSVIPSWAARDIAKSKTSDIRELCLKGIGIHNAGLPRSDRKLVERLFAEGILRVLCCTATLAWGVNLPARTVVIKGTDVYNAQKGGFEQLGMLDIMQIFGRAGRPQFDTEGEGTIITKHENLARYLNLLTAAVPIESTLGASASKLADHLNAEIVSGTVASIGEGVTWLSYTYLSVRMPKNPLVYGIDWADVAADPHLHSRRATLVEQASRALDDARMCRYDPRTGALASTELGRVCSHFYVSHRTVVLWNELMDDMAHFGEASESEENMENLYSAVLHAVSCASEFEQMRSREEESKELESLVRLSCPIRMKRGSETREGKVCILLQAYISRAPVRMSDLSYIVQSCTRLLRALFEMSIRRGLQGVALAALELARASECQIWPFQHPLLQFSYHARRGTGFVIPAEVIANLEELGPKGTLPALRKLDDAGISEIVRFPKTAQILKRTVQAIPILSIVETTVGPVTRSLLRFRIVLRPNFKWNEAIHGNMESWWVWIEDRQEGRIYHSERIVLNKTQAQNLSENETTINQHVTNKNPLRAAVGKQKQKGLLLDILVPVFDPPSEQYWIKVESEHWHTGGGSTKVLNLGGMVLPQREPPQTDLLDLRPLPVHKALPFNFANSFAGQFTHFNPIQTQLFHVMYHSDRNIFASVPLGSGKTALAEFAMFRAVAQSPHKCVVYLVPLANVAKKRTLDWKRRFGGGVFTRIIGLHEAEGSPFGEYRNVADIQGTLFVATPEAWYAYTKNWTPAALRRNVSTVIADEIHLLGEPQGHGLEVAISKIRFLSELGLGESLQGPSSVRIIGLSAPLANPMEFADWLGVDPATGVFNFRSSVRPVPCEIHLLGIAEELYVHRMQSMNKLIYSSILKFGSRKGTLVFTSSQRQAKLTAQDLIRSASIDGKERQFIGNVGGNAAEADALISRVYDSVVRSLLRSGIGIVHSSLHRKDRDAVVQLFEKGYIMVAITTFDAAWDTSLRAAHVVVKGTEKYSARQERFVDVGIVNILQMIGRAGRAQMDTECYAVVLAHERKKTLLKKFLYDPLPVESQLHRHLADHVHREIAAGRVRDAQDATDFISWTFLFRRLIMNPAFYGVTTHYGRRGGRSGKGGGNGVRNQNQVQIKAGDIEGFCSALVAQSITELWCSNAIRVADVAAGIRKKASREPKVELSALGWICVRSGTSCAIGGIMRGRIKKRMTFAHIIDLVSQCVAEEEISVNVNDYIVEHILAGLPSWYLASSGKEDRSRALDSFGITGQIGTLQGKLRLLLHGLLAGVSFRGSDYRTLMKDVLKSARKYVSVGLAIAGEGGMFTTCEQLTVLMQSLQQGYMPSAPVASVVDGTEGIELSSLLKRHDVDDIRAFLQDKKKVLSAARNSKMSKETVNKLEQFSNRIPELQIMYSGVEAKEGAHYVSVRAKMIWSSEIGRRLFLNETRGTRDALGPSAWLVLFGNAARDAVYALRQVDLSDAGREGQVISVKLDVDNNIVKNEAELHVTMMSAWYVGIGKECKIAV